MYGLLYFFLPVNPVQWGRACIHVLLYIWHLNAGNVVNLFTVSSTVLSQFCDPGLILCVISKECCDFCPTFLPSFKRRLCGLFTTLIHPASFWQQINENVQPDSSPNEKSVVLNADQASRDVVPLG